jgi:uncharacterized protein DUF4136
MFRCTRLTTIAACATAALILSGCATLGVHSYLARDADFAHYRSYAWVEPAQFATGDPRLDNNRFFSQRVEDAMDMQLAGRGFEKTSPAAADVLIHIHVRADRGATPEEPGALFVDVIDRRTTSLAWRGWAEGGLDDVVDNQRWMEARIDEAVTKIIARLPR